jgi:hypothetical protein
MSEAAKQDDEANETLGGGPMVIERRSGGSRFSGQILGATRGRAPA